MWNAVAASGLPVHFHTIGSGVRRDLTKLAPKVALAAPCRRHHHLPDVHVGGIAVVIFSGLEHHPGIKLVIGEAGTGWIPFILQRMDAEWRSTGAASIRSAAS